MSSEIPRYPNFRSTSRCAHNAEYAFLSTMYVALAQATATQSSGAAAAGEIHTAVIFVSAEEQTRAQAVAMERFESKGWRDVRMLTIGELEPSGVPANTRPEVHDALAEAVATGCAMVVFSDADEQYSA
jgi:hypothetical protein